MLHEETYILTTFFGMFLKVLFSLKRSKIISNDLKGQTKQMNRDILLLKARTNEELFCINYLKANEPCYRAIVNALLSLDAMQIVLFPIQR